MTLKEMLVQYREDHDISQRQFATICGLSNGYISMLERGENPKTKQPVTPTLPALKKLADGMGMSLSDLLVEVDDMPVELLSDAGEDTYKEMSALVKEGGLVDELDLELTQIIIQLSPDKKREALNYLRYLADRADT